MCKSEGNKLYIVAVVNEFWFQPLAFGMSRNELDVITLSQALLRGRGSENSISGSFSKTVRTY